MRYFAPVVLIAAMTCAAKPVSLPAAGAPARIVFPAVDTCAKAEGYRSTSALGDMLKVTTTDGAVLTYMNMGLDAGVLVGTAKSVAKFDRAEVREVGAERAAALWSCAIEAIAQGREASEAEKAVRRDEREATRDATRGEGGGGLARALATTDKVLGAAERAVDVADSASATADGGSAGGGAVQSAPASDADRARFADMEPCARLVACNAALAEELCKGADSCEVEIKVSGNDPKSCADAMSKVDEMLGMYRMMKPGLKKPAACP